MNAPKDSLLLPKTPKMKNEIELYSRIVNPMDAIAQVGTFFAKSGMFGCERVEQGMVLAMECLATNKPPSVIARTYHIMDGKLSKKALAALAEFRAAGGKHKWIRTGEEAVAKEDERAAELELVMDGNTIRHSFSIADARRMGLSFKPGSGWAKAAGNMLRARCITNAVAMLAPEIFAGDVEDDTPQSVAPLLVEPASESIDVETVPTTEAADPSKPTDSVPSSSTPAGESGKLPNETQQAVINAIGANNLVALVRYLRTSVTHRWLADDQDLDDLTPKQAQILISQSANVIRRITEAKQNPSL